jgi:heme/copper-type cytochrome/quinol oxidase subunit 2
MKNLDQTLAIMAEKLGTKAELLWPQLVAIQRLDWFVNLGIVLVFTVLTTVFYFWYRKSEARDEYSDACTALAVIGIFCAAIAAVAFLVLIIYIPSQLIYPEIGALHSLMNR